MTSRDPKQSGSRWGLRVPSGLMVFSTLLAAGPVAVAADHLNLDTGLPTVVEDAYPIKDRSIEVQGAVRYDHTRSIGTDAGHDHFEVAPRIEYGAARNFQLSVASPYREGNAQGTSQGDFQLDGLYNFNMEGLVLPAFSIDAGVDQPYGAGRGGTETRIKGIITKTIGTLDDSYIPRRLHLNLSWMHNWEPMENERRNRYLVGLAYSQPLDNGTVVVAEVFRESRRERNEDYNLASVGIRRQLTPLTVVSFGAGAGFGGDSPRWQVMFGIQHALGSWPLGM